MFELKSIVQSDDQCFDLLRIFKMMKIDCVAIFKNEMAFDFVDFFWVSTEASLTGL